MTGRRKARLPLKKGQALPFKRLFFAPVAPRRGYPKYKARFLARYGAAYSETTQPPRKKKSWARQAAVRASPQKPAQRNFDENFLP